MPSLYVSYSSDAWSACFHTFSPYPEYTQLMLLQDPLKVTNMSHQLSVFGNKYWLKGSLLQLNGLQKVTNLQTQNIRNKKA